MIKKTWKYINDKLGKFWKSEMSTKVFISYTHVQPDKMLAEKFKEALNSFDHEVFIDVKIGIGDRWAKSIDRALRACDVLLLLLSKNAANSEAVMAEVRIAKMIAAKHSGKPWILPIRISIPFDVPLPYEMNIAVESLQQAFWDGKSSADDLVNQIMPYLSKGYFEGFIPEIPDIKDIDKTPKIIKSNVIPRADPSFISQLNRPYGAIALDNSFYIKRESDEDVLFALDEDRAVIALLASRQMGKTSLLIRAAHFANQKGIRVAFIDFSAFPKECFTSDNMLWKRVARRIERDLHLSRSVIEKWDNDGETFLNLEDFFKSANFDFEQTPTLICMDEIDRILKHQSSNAFFSILRAIHSLSAIYPLWKKIRWLLAGSTEPAFFIKNQNQSPFNIGHRIELRDFNEIEVFELAKRYRFTKNTTYIKALYRLLHGQPYLTQLALYLLTTGKTDFNHLITKCITEESVFREHLKRFSLHLQHDKVLGRAMYDIVNGRKTSDIESIRRLQGAGLIKPAGDGYVARCKLYQYYFNKYLKRIY